MNNIEKKFNPKELIKKGFYNIEDVTDGYRYHDFFQYLITEKLDIISDLAIAQMKDSLMCHEISRTDFLASDLFIAISTIPCTIEEARSKYYSDGYLENLHQILKVARNIYPSSHFFHIQFFGNGTSFWIQMTFRPEKKKLPFPPTYYLPYELLTYKEELKVGIIKPNTDTQKEKPIHSKQLRHSWLNKVKSISTRLFYGYIVDLEDEYFE